MGLRPRASAVLDRVRSEDRLNRLLGVMFRFTYFRAGVVRNRELERTALGAVFKSPRGRFEFSYPPVREGTDKARHQHEIVRLIWRSGPRLITGPWFEPRWIAAAVYIGREYLVAPARLASRKLTQERVSKYFRLSAGS